MDAGGGTLELASGTNFSIGIIFIWACFYDIFLSLCLMEILFSRQPTHVAVKFCFEWPQVLEITIFIILHTISLIVINNREIKKKNEI